MSIDRFVRFEEPLEVEEVHYALVDYLGGAGSVEGHYVTKPMSGRFVYRLGVCLPGFNSAPFARCDGVAPVPYHLTVESRVQRTFGVRIVDQGKTLHVFIDLADEFTLVVAEGFAQAVARFWQGKIDPA